MKIWCVEYAGMNSIINRKLFFTKAEAENFYDYYGFEGAYHKMYQVEDIWHWCARHFNEVLHEIITSRDSGDDFTYIWGMVDEIKAALEWCDIEDFTADMIVAHENEYDPEYTVYVLSVAWFYEGKMHHYMDKFYGLDVRYEYPTIIERRTKWEK